MRKLKFESTQEFEQYFKVNSYEATAAIASAIEEAITHRKNTALLFECTFTGAELAYEISLPKVEWVGALDSCLNYFHEFNHVDQAIDTWKLREAAKVL
jgi:hypothetical protein